MAYKKFSEIQLMLILLVHQRCNLWPTFLLLRFVFGVIDDKVVQGRKREEEIASD